MYKAVVAVLLGLFAIAQAAQVIAPSYYYPGPLWTQTTQAGSKVGIMVANPNSGPGSSVNSAYRSAITAAQAKGVKVVGYVHLSYGTRAQSAVTADIQKWYSFYPTLDGIFFDECPAGTSGIPYVSSMSAVVKKYKKNVLILNPGIYPDKGYMSLADVVLVFEGSYSSYLKKTIPTWVSSFPATKFYHIVHGCSSGNFANALKLANSRRAGYVFMTDDIMPNPYDKLPTYWTAQLAAMTVSSTPTPCTCPNDIPVVEEVPSLEEQEFERQLVAQIELITQQNFGIVVNATAPAEAVAAAEELAPQALEAALAVDSFELV